MSCFRPDGNGLMLPTGQEVLGSLVSAVGAELAGGLAGPLLYLAFLSTPAQAVPIEWRDQLREQLRTFLQEWANTMERREHLRLLGWIATAVAASPILRLDSDEQERLSKVVAVPSRVDDFATAAQGLAVKTDDHLLQACTSVEFGMAYAVDGQYRECMTEFDRALDNLSVPASC